MNKGMILFCLILMGCSAGAEKIKHIIENPESIIQDTQFTEYRDQLDQLERDYLKKKITYSEYLEKKKEWEDLYTRQVEERKNIIEQPMPER